jgi:hypothetical protein
LLSTVVPHSRFQEYHGAQAPAEYTGHTLEDFVAQRDHLVPGVVHQLVQAVKGRLGESGHATTEEFEITTAMMGEYRLIREEIGVENDISHPERIPRLWAFLRKTVDELYPELQATAKVVLGEPEKGPEVVTEARDDNTMAPEAEASVSESTPTPSKPQDAVPTVSPKTTENPARKQPGPVVTAAAASEPESRTVSGAENRHPPKAQANPQATTIPPTKISPLAKTSTSGACVESRTMRWRKLAMRSVTITRRGLVNVVHSSSKRSWAGTGRQRSTRTSVRKPRLKKRRLRWRNLRWRKMRLR